MDGQTKFKNNSNKIQEQFKPYLHRKNELSVESDCLIWGNRVIIPFHLRNKILTELHENHPGIVRMKALACSYVWWASMDIEIENTVKSCNACKINHTCQPKHLHILGKKQLLLG